MADATETVVNEQPEQEQVASEAAPAVDADAAAAEVPAAEAPAAEAPADEQGGAAPEYGAPAVPDAAGEQPEATEQQAAPAEAAEQAAGDAAPASDFVAAAQAQAAALAAKFAEDSNKRRLDDGDEPEAKRHQSNGASYGQVVVNPGGDASFTLMAPPDKVGRIIGRAGVTIKDLEGRTSTRIQIDHKADGDKPVHVTGPSAGAVEACRSLIIDLLESENPYGQGAPGGDTTKSVSCPPGIVGRVIGRGGETIRSLQAASQAHIVVDQNFPADQDRQITISGRPDAVDRAVKMIQELVAGEPGSAQQIIQKYGAGLTRVLECAKAVVGRVIGKGGETIKDLQRRFSVSIQIDQSASPCKITIAGQGHTVDHCRQAILDILEDRPPHGMGGPGGGGGPGGFPGPRPGYGAPGPYGGGGGGYGGAPPFNPGYGGGGFGGAPAYGGYGGYGGPQPGYGGYGGQQPYPAAQPAYAQHAPAAGGYGSYGQAGAADPYAAYAQQQQAAPAQPAATSTWQELRDDQGRTYYYNSTTGVSQWERPAEMH